MFPRQFSPGTARENSSGLNSGERPQQAVDDVRWTFETPKPFFWAPDHAVGALPEHLFIGLLNERREYQHDELFFELRVKSTATQAICEGLNDLESNLEKFAKDIYGMKVSDCSLLLSC